ncbi:GntR family transcriptional regulator [Microbulbifer thermotolerans]|uniref:GntR family transcriptional regulator n=1 Tax=Microbulbifer thermotolerans TaxID=252514 RepID=A0A143HIQ6_MICTH|nr:GntR family transcriptional regulator [Microbulbifer thermotolerans]AMX01553.1 GntR family transcriptional regulator [Microbulbifer thermotolerans]MCX2778407.1 GntR family transcriptional regulator [Microbulbifer thermotolerans]MCX2803043.1 GntR family transcriptional regulator [Microbulbifer thermotolerans]MCX2804446.1 GntR family transcriptional regulator [Microbulbifer thermotolerans]MCX2832594.1 GntR family transcriptional regulator [Microbulbifer thermotolerans]
MGLYQRLKSDLQQGRFAPGRILKQSELAEMYGVSRIPVRDALQRLKSEGWLSGHGKRGVAVPLFDPLEVEDLYLMRTRLEPLLLELAAPHLSGEILGRAEDILDRMEIGNQLEAAEIGALNREFHACLYRPAGRRTLFATVEQLHQQCERYIGYQSRGLDYQAQSQSEHYEILSALRQGEIQQATCILGNHISAAGQALVQHLRNP